MSLGCTGVELLKVSGSCSSSISFLEVSYDGGVNYESLNIVDEGGGLLRVGIPWSHSLQPNGELRFKVTIEKPTCLPRYLYATLQPDLEECSYGGMGLIFNSSSAFEVLIPTGSSTYPYNYQVNWGDSNFESGILGNVTHSYASGGDKTVKITGDFPRIEFGNSNVSQDYRDKLVEITDWGTLAWKAFNNAFRLCTNLEVTATNIPNLNSVTTLASMFNGCSNLTSVPNINNWNVSNVTSIAGMFIGTTFDGNVGSWDVSKVTNMFSTFANCPFNNGGSDSIKNWNTSNVDDFGMMFYTNNTFNQPLTNWNTSNASSFGMMFYSASSFNQSLYNFSIAGVSSGTSTSINSSALSGMLNACGLDSTNYSNFLVKLLYDAVDYNKTYIQLDAEGLKYNPVGESAKQDLQDVYGWVINDAGLE